MSRSPNIMANDDVIELDSSDDEAEPEPKKVLLFRSCFTNSSNIYNAIKLFYFFSPKQPQM